MLLEHLFLGFKGSFFAQNLLLFKVLQIQKEQMITQPRSQLQETLFSGKAGIQLNSGIM